MAAYKLTAIDKNGDVITTTTLTVKSGNHTAAIVEAGEQGLAAIAGAVTVLCHNENGCFVLASHDDGPAPLHSVATAWWNLPQQARDDASVGAYRARRRSETLWGDSWAEVEAWGRLRAALRGIGGDL